MDKCTSLKINVVVFVLMNISQKRVIYRLLSVKHFLIKFEKRGTTNLRTWRKQTTTESSEIPLIFSKHSLSRSYKINNSSHVNSVWNAESKSKWFFLFAHQIIFFSTTQFSRSLLQLKQDERTEIVDIYVPTTGALFPGRHFEIPSATPIYLACVQTPPPPPL